MPALLVCAIFCIMYLVPHTWYLIPGTRYQIPGTWYISTHPCVQRETYDRRHTCQTGAKVTCYLARLTIKMLLMTSYFRFLTREGCIPGRCPILLCCNNSGMPIFSVRAEALMLERVFMDQDRACYGIASNLPGNKGYKASRP